MPRTFCLYPVGGTFVPSGEGALHIERGLGLRCPKTDALSEASKETSEVLAEGGPQFELSHQAAGAGAAARYACGLTKDKAT